ncbi:MAG: hypothetical protein LBS01_03385 [Prevotellaceae bacterium]|jgi:hypothetical protein|nr:hypothetical protein [Prevotellaceae bacterium]
MVINVNAALEKGCKPAMQQHRATPCETECRHSFRPERAKSNDRQGVDVTMITPLRGLCIMRVLLHRALPYAIDCTAFSRLSCLIIHNLF